jgi:glycosyltransferase involved in cell wall biosynthesis
MKYDGLILTLNEADTIEACIKSLFLVCDNVFVLDSLSSDDTVALAKSAGATVMERPFDNYAAQRNFALNCFDFVNDFILFFDADERLSPELVEELSQLAIDKDDSILFIRRFDILWGKKMMYATGYPTWGARGFRRGNVFFTREINEGVEYSGNSVHLKEHFDHFPLIKGFDWWLQRHAKYAKMEANQILLKNYRILASDFKKFDSVSMRLLAKKIVYNLPLRPYLIFCLFYIVKRGFLDGSAGLQYARMRFYYEYLINLYVKLDDFR